MSLPDDWLTNAANHPWELGDPDLGLATTAELLNELRARIEIDYYAGGGGLDYTTVGGRPPEGVTVEVGAVPE